MGPTLGGAKAREKLPGDEVVNRSPIRYDFPGGVKVIRIVYTRNIDWIKYLSL